MTSLPLSEQCVAFATDAERRQDCRSQHDVSGFRRMSNDDEAVVIRTMCRPLRWMLQATRQKSSHSCDIFLDGSRGRPVGCSQRNRYVKRRTFLLVNVSSRPIVRFTRHTSKDAAPRACLFFWVSFFSLFIIAIHYNTYNYSSWRFPHETIFLTLIQLF